MGDKLEMSFEIQGVGMSLAGLGDAKGGLRLVSAAKAEWLRIGVDLQLKFWNDLLNRYMGTAREAIAPADAERAWSEGAGTSFDNATATALSVSVPRSDVLLENR